jgi:ABC-type branched-subunit amino acid transport system substrate-binding protein
VRACSVHTEVPAAFLLQGNFPHVPDIEDDPYYGRTINEAHSTVLARAVERLIEQEVDVIIGPVFSDEAIEAGAVSEEYGVPFFAPLATDDRVSEGRQYVFQANPSLSIRGRQMARFAVEDMELETIGIAVSMDNPLSERMAERFQEESLMLGD